MKNELFVILNGEVRKGVLVGKYLTEKEWYESKFKYVYQIKIDSWNYDQVSFKREEIFFTEKEAMLFLDKSKKKEQIREAKIQIEKYEEAVKVLEKARKEGLTDLDFDLSISDELKKAIS